MDAPPVAHPFRGPRTIRILDLDPKGTGSRVNYKIFFTLTLPARKLDGIANYCFAVLTKSKRGSHNQQKCEARSGAQGCCPHRPLGKPGHSREIDSSGSRPANDAAQPGHSLISCLATLRGHALTCAVLRSLI